MEGLTELGMNVRVVRSLKTLMTDPNREQIKVTDDQQVVNYAMWTLCDLLYMECIHGMSGSRCGT